MLPRIDHVIEKAKSYNPSSDSRLLQRAYLFSAFAHEGQTRLSGEPYLVHPIAVAAILADLKADDIALVAGLLHDVVEDNHAVPLSDIERRFGPEVAHIVDGVTKIEEKVPLQGGDDQHWANLRKVILAMVDDIRVILVKLADRLHNLRTMQAMPEHRRPVKAMETLEIYAPIAYRLGMGKMKIELEDLGFRYGYPEEFARLQATLQEKRSYSDDFIEETSVELQGTLKAVGVQGKVFGRTKHLYSIWQKLQRQGISVEQVYDYMAFRILVESVKDCYAVLGGVHSMWKPIPGRFKDFIALPKENHYRSLHTSVVGHNGQPFEIQIRTYQMHEEAENGIAAHWQYKEGRLSKEDESATMVWLRQVMEWKQETSASDFVQNLRVDLFPKEVYVFTPQGKVLSFSRGATPIDFAYAIHSEVGHHCVGAKVNNKLVPLKTPLKSGDRVEIITSPTGKPSRDWLKAAVTSRALSKIKAWLNQQEKTRAVELGKAALDRECKRLKVNFGKAQESGLLAEALKKVSLPDLDSLYAAVGYGKLSARIFVRKLAAPEEPQPLAAKPGQVSEGKREPALVVPGTSDLLTTLARCCKPIPGDDVVGFISRGRGLVVHRADCPNVTKVGYNPDRLMEVRWGDKAPSSAAHDVHIAISVEDRPGTVASITKIVADAKAPLKQIEGSVNAKGRGLVRMTLGIRDRNHLNNILTQISKLEGILEIHRLNR